MSTNWQALQLNIQRRDSQFLKEDFLEWEKQMTGMVLPDWALSIITADIKLNKGELIPPSNHFIDTDWDGGEDEFEGD